MRKLPGPAGFQDNNTLVNDNEHPEEIDLNEKNTQATSLEIQRMIENSWDTILERVFGFALSTNSTLVKIQDIYLGIYDLKIPQIVLIIDSIKHSFDDSLILRCKDNTGYIDCFICKNQLNKYARLNYFLPLQNNMILYLRNISIYVEKCPVNRYLSLHCKNIVLARLI